MAEAARRVLLIDDRPEQLLVIGRLLEKANYSVDKVSSAENALEQASKQEFDVVVSDIIMPEMNGIEFVERLRKFPLHWTTPVVMITEGRDELEVDSMFAGADAFCPKNSAKDRLVSTIEKLFE